jgi:hypothetical protein
MVLTVHAPPPTLTATDRMELCLQPSPMTSPAEPGPGRGLSNQLHENFVAAVVAEHGSDGFGESGDELRDYARPMRRWAHAPGAPAAHLAVPHVNGDRGVSRQS